MADLDGHDSGGSYRRIGFRLRPASYCFPMPVWNLGDRKESFVRFQCELPSLLEVKPGPLAVCGPGTQPGAVFRCLEGKSITGADEAEESPMTVFYLCR